MQTDDRAWVDRTVTEFARRIRSTGSRVEGPRNGWTAVYDAAADADHNALLRLARELSERLGAIVIALALEVDQVVRMIALDRGGIVDEYLSVPEYYGTLPPGDVIGLAANPTVLARLTGADPAAVKAVARTAPSAAELPPPRELLAAIAAVLGLEGTAHGYEAAWSMLTLYDAARCPFCARVRIVLAEKDVPHEAIAIDLDDRPDWIVDKNPPAGRVPVLEEDGWVLPESAVIDEYLDERYPDPPLLPADPAERAAARFIVFRFDDFQKPYYAVRRGDAGAEAAFSCQLAALDRLLGAMPYLTGRAFGLADVAYLPWVIRARDQLGLDLGSVAGADRMAAARSRTTVRRSRAGRRRGAPTMTDVTTEELASRLGEPGLVLLDVRAAHEYSGALGAPCDPRQGHIPGARHLDVRGAARARARRCPRPGRVPTRGQR